MKVHAPRNQKPFKLKEFLFPFSSKSFDFPSLILNRQYEHVYNCEFTRCFVSFQRPNT